MSELLDIIRNKEQKAVEEFYNSSQDKYLEGIMDAWEDAKALVKEHETNKQEKHRNILDGAGCSYEKKTETAVEKRIDGPFNLKGENR